MGGVWGGAGHGPVSSFCASWMVNCCPGCSEAVVFPFQRIRPFCSTLKRRAIEYSVSPRLTV